MSTYKYTKYDVCIKAFNGTCTVLPYIPRTRINMYMLVFIVVVVRITSCTLQERYSIESACYTVMYRGTLTYSVTYYHCAVRIT